MALPKKGRRDVHVDGQHYVWLSKYFVDEEDPCEAQAHLVVARAGDAPGQLLLATVYHVTTLDLGVVTRTIRWARRRGWTPDVKNPTPFRLKAEHEAMLEPGGA
jgi:hypothetical protein